MQAGNNPTLVEDTIGVPVGPYGRGFHAAFLWIETVEQGNAVMSEATKPLAGGCQCGAVRYEYTGKPLQLVICHCKECQKQTSSAFGMTLPVAKLDFRVLSGTLKE